MSYAGVYGQDETCVHDSYQRNCWRCNGAVDRFAREYPDRLAHPELAKSITPSSRVITVYDASCSSPLCQWQRTGVLNAEQLAKDIQDHIAACLKVASDWSSASDIKSAAGIV